MSKKDDKLDDILKSLKELTEMLVDDIEEIEEPYELPPSDFVATFRITEKVVKAIEKELGKGWMDSIGIT